MGRAGEWAARASGPRGRVGRAGEWAAEVHILHINLYIDSNYFFINIIFNHRYPEIKFFIKLFKSPNFRKAEF